MRMTRLTAAIAGLAAGLAVPALADVAGSLEVVGAWSRPAAAGMTGAGYMTVENHGQRDQTLVRVETAVARKVEMHRTVVHAGVARMEPIGRLTVPARGEARFEPGGQHLMLIGLSRPLRAGERVPATLVFASGVTVKAELIVGPGAPAAPAAPHAHH